MTRISVFTPTRGEHKTPYLFEAYESLKAQTMKDWEWWILDNSDSLDLYHQLEEDGNFDSRLRYVWDNDFDRSAVHPMPYLLNKYYPQAAGDLIFYLSDDDLIRADLFSVFTEFFDANPDEDACWVTLEHRNVLSERDEGIPAGRITANERRGSGGLDNRVDGGQICHRKSVLPRMQRWFPESADDAVARHCDGQFMENMAAAGVSFAPAGNPDIAYVTHRTTPVSTFTRYGGPYGNGKIGV